MEYVQERIATLHDFAGRVPEAPTDEACVVVPVAGRECRTPAAEGVLSTLESVDPGRVLIALRADPGDVADHRRWLRGFDLDLDVLWCTAPAVGDLLADHGLDGAAGKGRDLWLALGVAAEHPYVVCHDADTATYSAGYVPRLLAPLADGFGFTKGYYARIEDRRLYGRLFRLLYAPLVEALRDRHGAPILAYLGAFRYALAGEFAMAGGVARRVRLERRFGLEAGLLGEAFREVGADAVAQVDLGRYEHEHRDVGGSAGLAAMSEDVAAALLRVVEDGGVAPDYAALPDAYRETARRYVRQYAADAAFNGLAYDADAEREQVEAYAGSIAPPASDARLPAWEDVDLDPGAVLDAAADDPF